MAGLILKDLLYLRRSGRTLAILVAFYAVFFILMGKSDSAFGLLCGLIVMLTLILSINAFSYDEAAKWTPYEQSLPVSKSRIVLARYLLALGISCVLALVLFFAGSLAFGFSLETAVSFWVSWNLSLILCSVLFPLLYRYGTQKARLFFLILILFPSLAVYLLAKLGLPMPGESGLLLGVKLLPLFTAALFWLSYRLSRRILSRKED